METPGRQKSRVFTRIEIEKIFPNPSQPRKRFDPESLSRLADSISEYGLLSPILVRRIGVEKYELVAGERRLRAMKILGWTHAEAVIIAAFDLDSAILSLIENIQREDVNYLDEAAACRAILDTSSLTQEELARRLGKSPSALANRLRLLNLSGQTKEFLTENPLSERHARALLCIFDAENQLSLAKEAFDKKLSVRQLERRIENIKKSQPRSIKSVCRDMRLYINAVMDTVARLKKLGAQATEEIKHTDSGLDIIIHITSPKEKAEPENTGPA